MAVRLYNEYIKVDPNFIPVFSRNSDRIYPDKWQSFYPHTSFKNILKDVVETLEKSNETKDRSIWMSGAYGTGKTYASFVIKHICTGYLKLLFPNATDVSKVDVSLFETYCLAPAMEMRRVIKTQLGIIDEGEFGGMTIPEITIKEQYREK